MSVHIAAGTQISRNGGGDDRGQGRQSEPEVQHKNRPDRSSCPPPNQGFGCRHQDDATQTGAQGRDKRDLQEATARPNDFVARERITIDFVIYSGARLFVQDKGVPYEEAELHLRNARPDIPDGTIVECGYNDLGFFVEKIRTDKTHANNRRTFSRTMVNIREAIKYDELLGV